MAALKTQANGGESLIHGTNGPVQSEKAFGILIGGGAVDVSAHLRGSAHFAPRRSADTRHRVRRFADRADVDRPGVPSQLFGEGDTSIHVLAADVGDEKNTRSIVLLESFRNFDVILTGDATEETETDILSRYDA